MSFVFEMPEIGEGVVEGEVVEWKVSVGDRVEIDQPLCDVMTDKANVEISSPRAGTIAKLFGEPGDIIAVHTPLVEISEGAAAPVENHLPVTTGKSPQPMTPMAAPTRQAAPNPKSNPPRPALSPPVISTQPAPPKRRTSVTKAPPAVRRHAREDGVDLELVEGTGPGGRITHVDVDRAQAPAVQAVRLPNALPQPDVVPSGQSKVVKIIGLRRKIAEQMSRSISTAAHFTYVEECDCNNLVAVRKMLKPIAEAQGSKLNYLPFVMKACSIAFRDFPSFNAHMNEEAFALHIKGDHHIGFACDTPNGLVVAVIKNVEQKSILRIAAEMTDLSARARAGKASLPELSGSTFTLTGVGTMGVHATPIINVPEVAILGFNAIRDAAVAHEGQVVIRKRTFLSGSFDHRVIDGALAARFTARVQQILQNPGELLTEIS